MDSQPRQKRGHTRRSFLTRSALFAGAVSLAATGWDKTLGRAVAAIAPSAEARHRRTYVSLVDAVAASERNGLSPAASAEAGQRFDAWYELQPSHTQREADCILDDVEAAFGKHAFHKAARADRLDFIQERAHGPYRNLGLRRGSGEAKAGPTRIEQIREAASDPRYHADPTDFSTAKAVPADPDAPPIPEPNHTKEDVRRTAHMEAVLMLVAAPLSATADSTDPEDLTKVDPIAV